MHRWVRNPELSRESGPRVKSSFPVLISLGVPCGIMVTSWVNKVGGTHEETLQSQEQILLPSGGQYPLLVASDQELTILDD